MELLPLTYAANMCQCFNAPTMPSNVQPVQPALYCDCLAAQCTKARLGCANVCTGPTLPGARTALVFSDHLRALRPRQVVVADQLVLRAQVALLHELLKGAHVLLRVVCGGPCVQVVQVQSVTTADCHKENPTVTPPSTTAKCHNCKVSPSLPHNTLTHTAV